MKIKGFNDDCIFDLRQTNPRAHDYFYKKLGVWISDRAHQEQDSSDYKFQIGELHEILDSFNDALADGAQSPIEEILAAGLIFATDGYHQVSFTLDLAYPLRPKWGTIFTCQGVVGSYAADFMIEVIAGDYVRKIAIECDGHDHHEKTKQQAQRDKKRDRFFTNEDIKILRFTGSEIYRDPDACIEEIESVITKELDKCMISAGLIKDTRPKK